MAPASVVDDVERRTFQWFWDTADPYDYLRIEPNGGHDLVIFGGEDHKTGQASSTDACFDRLDRTLTSILGGVDIRAMLRALGFEPGERRLAELGPPQKTKQVNGFPVIGAVDEQGALLGFAYFGTTTSMMTVMQSRLADHERGRAPAGAERASRTRQRADDEADRAGHGRTDPPDPGPERPPARPWRATAAGWPAPAWTCPTRFRRRSPASRPP